MMANNDEKEIWVLDTVEDCGRRVYFLKASERGIRRYLEAIMAKTLKDNETRIYKNLMPANELHVKGIGVTLQITGRLTFVPNEDMEYYLVKDSEMEFVLQATRLRDLDIAEIKENETNLVVVKNPLLKELPVL